MNIAQHIPSSAFQPMLQPSITFNAYGSQLRALTSDELISKDNFLARTKKTKTEHIVEIITHNGTNWIPCAFGRFKYENDALYWVEAINANVDIDKMISGLFNR